MLSCVTGRADAIRRSYRLAPDVIDLIDRHARDERTTATAIIEAAVRAYAGRAWGEMIEARVAALEARLDEK